MTNPRIDKGILVMVLSPIIGLLVMKGYIEPENADQLTDALAIFLGAAIGVIGVIAGLHHSREEKKLQSTHKSSLTATVTETSSDPNTQQPIVTTDQPVQ